MNEIDKVDKLLLNMSAGLLPVDLDKEEVNLLKERFGNNWFNELGYSEDKHERSKYDHYNTRSFDW